MSLNLFDQFNSPHLWGIPLAIVALLAPWSIFPTPSPRLWCNRVPRALSSSFETILRQILTPLTAKGHVWALKLVSLLILLITMNMLGCLPYTFTPTTQLSVTLGLAFPLWLATVIVGLRLFPLRSIAHLVPESTPAPLIPVLIMIETISLLVRPLALGVRLAANLTAGHIILHMISSATLGLLCSADPTFLLGATVLVLLTCLELMVAAIQAYVFVLLLSLYLQENV